MTADNKPNSDNLPAKFNSMQRNTQLAHPDQFGLQLAGNVSRAEEELENEISLRDMAFNSKT
jgi:hypothetical protein